MKAAGVSHQRRCGHLAIRRWDAVAFKARVHAKNLSERLKSCNSIGITDSSRFLGRAAPRKTLRGARIVLPPGQMAFRHLSRLHLSPIVDRDSI